MPRKPKPERDDPEQSKRFEETAREGEFDEQAFQRAIDSVLRIPKDDEGPTKR